MGVCFYYCEYCFETYSDHDDIECRCHLELPDDFVGDDPNYVEVKDHIWNFHKVECPNCHICPDCIATQDPKLLSKIIKYRLLLEALCKKAVRLYSVQCSTKNDSSDGNDQ